MNSSKNEAFLLGFQDLLFCGSGALLLLFFIFAIKIGGKSVIPSRQELNKEGNFKSIYSIPTENRAEEDGRMQTMRTVSFQFNTRSDYSKIKKFITTGSGQKGNSVGKWDLRSYEGKPEERSKIIEQVVFNDEQKSISHILILEFLNSPEIRLDISKGILNLELNGRVKIIMRLIEGKGLPYFPENKILETTYSGVSECRREGYLENIDAIIFKVQKNSEDQCRFFSIR